MLADPARRRIVELLVSGPRRAGAIADELGMSAAASSRHLQQLHEQRVVTVTPDPADARARMYELQPERLVGLSAWLDQVQAHWSERLDAFKARTEQRGRER